MPLRLLQGLMWFVAGSHAVVGAGAMASQQFREWAAAGYGASVAWTPQFVYILKPLGAFMVVLGGLGAAAALDPLRHRLIVYGFVALLLLRDAQRLLFQEEIREAFGVTPARNLAAGGFFLALAVALVVLLRLAERGRPAGPA